MTVAATEAATFVNSRPVISRQRTGPPVIAFALIALSPSIFDIFRR